MNLTLLTGSQAGQQKVKCLSQETEKFTRSECLTGDNFIWIF